LILQLRRAVGWIRKSIFYFAKYEIKIYLEKFRTNNFAKFREISQINVGKFRRQSFHGNFLLIDVRFNLKRDPDLVQRVDLILHAPL
jgi:hypothetical protein